MKRIHCIDIEPYQFLGCYVVISYNATPLSVRVNGKNISLYMIVDEKAPVSKRNVVIAETYEDVSRLFSANSMDYKFVGSVDYGDDVYHVFIENSNLKHIVPHYKGDKK